MHHTELILHLNWNNIIHENVFYLNINSRKSFNKEEDEDKSDRGADPRLTPRGGGWVGEWTDPTLTAL